MANGKKVQTVQPWYPANDAEAEKAAQGDIYQGVDGQLYQHQDMPQASPKNPPEPVATADLADAHPQATAPATSESGPSGDVADVSKPDSTPPSIENSASFRKAIPGGPTDPSYDSDKFDSTGKAEKDDAPVGPRGVNQPMDVMSDADRARVGAKQEAKMRQGMSSTDLVDSIGKPKGHFETAEQGVDKHGMRIADGVDFASPIEPHVPLIGPRGVGAPKDTFQK